MRKYKQPPHPCPVCSVRVHSCGSWLKKQPTRGNMNPLPPHPWPSMSICGYRTNPYHPEGDQDGRPYNNGRPNNNGTQNRQCAFVEILDGRMVLNEYEEIVRDEWKKSGEIRNEI